MTTEEFNYLSPNQVYEFKIYNGEKHFGYPYIDHTDSENENYLIPLGSNPIKNIKEIGIKINPEAIVDTPRRINQEEIRRLSVVYADAISMPSSQFKATKMVILGAGASYDYSWGFDETDERPPLVNQLFDDTYNDILNQYPGAMNLSSELLRVPDIEAHFQKLWKKVKESYNPELLSHLIDTQYYLRHLFLHISQKFRGERKNNYNNLVHLTNDYLKLDKHKNEYILYVSFNYDTLIEEALTATLKYPFNRLDDYVDFTKKKILLFKPHGSCNWAKKLKIMPSEGATSGRIIDYSTHLHKYNFSLSSIYDAMEDEIMINDTPATAAIANELKRIYPWLLIPYKNKDEFVMPSKHSAILRYLVKDIKDILVIGWKGSEEFFLNNILKNRIGSTQPNIHIINKEDKSIFENFKYNKVFTEEPNWIEYKERDALFSNAMFNFLNESNPFFGE